MKKTQVYRDLLVGAGKYGLLGVLVLAPLDASQGQEPSVWEREKLTGTWGGARTQLQQNGIVIDADYIAETFSILSGGLRRSTTYEGRFTASIDTDLDKLVGWSDAKTHVKAFQIHNGGANAAAYAGTLADPSNIDALPTTRLFTAWFQQDFGQRGSLRIGQLAVDDEFLTSATAGGLINGTFGWANIMAANLPSGGPAYPLAAPGARLQLNVNDNVTFLGAVFSGDPARAGCYTDPQACNKHGTTFSFSGGAFWIAELQYQVNQGKEATDFAAAYKVGAWYHSGEFADQRLGVDAAGNIVTLALNPENSLNHRGNWGIYGIIDQMLWRDRDSSISVFARGGVAPNDRNLLSWYVDAGVGITGVFAGRPDDKLTFGVAHSNMSSAARTLDRDILALNGPPYPARTAETVFELSYIFQVTPWWSLQPDIQYIVRPQGGVAHPDDPVRSIGHVLLFGARTTFIF